MLVDIGFSPKVVSKISAYHLSALLKALGQHLEWLICDLLRGGEIAFRTAC